MIEFAWVKDNDLVANSLEKYLNEKYKESGVEFIVMGILLHACKKNETHCADVDATIQVPVNADLSDEYKENLDKFAIQPIIKTIDKRLAEEK